MMFKSKEKTQWNSWELWLMKTRVSCEQNSKECWSIFKASHYLNSKSLRNIYFALVHPYIDYGNVAWVSTNKNYLKRILGKQN